MGTHPIFETDFDCLTEIMENENVSPTAKRQRGRKRKASNSVETETDGNRNSFPIGSVDDPLGLDGIAQDSIIPDIEENEFTEKPTGAIPKNLTDPLGLEEDEKAKKQTKGKRRASAHQIHGKKNTQKKGKSQSQKEKQTFPHGNYIQYYGYRNDEKFKDYRVGLIKKEWVNGLDVLDIGCNTGHLTLLVARDLKPRKIVGVDIDEHLISLAQRNIRHYCPTERNFPESFAKLYGPLRAPFVNTGQATTGGKEFPENVCFIQGNYVFSCDDYLDRQEPEYDTVIAFSVTKWVHLNNGDLGMKRFFRRIYRQLRPGGRLLLEPQPWKSYSRRKKLTKEISENYKNLKFKPAQFTEFLTSIGFSEPINLTATSETAKKGFKQREVLLYNKPLNI